MSTKSGDFGFRLFLYGTLKPGQYNWWMIKKYIEQGSRMRLTPATIRGKLYIDTQFYLPYYVLEGDQNIVGLILETDNLELMREIFNMEVGAGYEALQKEAYVMNRGILPCWVYGVRPAVIRKSAHGVFKVCEGGIYNIQDYQKGG
jgi:gamma-glutamylcyclotransferase (GGCT)/AIG2-like uncharacterized protein YtfP